MLLSHGAPILRSALHFNGRKQAAVNLKQIRNKWCYRSVPKADTPWVITAELTAGVMWWWIFWNAWYEFDHIVGHYPYPRPVEWTDEELGIPPDY